MSSTSPAIDESIWPEFESERIETTLLSVELYERRFLSTQAYHQVIHHLIRCASAACLLHREDEAIRLIGRAGARTLEWLTAVRLGRLPASALDHLALTRGLLALTIATLDDDVHTLSTFLQQTAATPAGPVHNARMVAALLVGDAGSFQHAAERADRSDAGLGLPFKRFALALLANDHSAMLHQLRVWLQEKAESTQTLEWGAYNEVPIEVSGALALAERRGHPLRLASNRILTRFRAVA